MKYLILIFLTTNVFSLFIPTDKIGQSSGFSLERTLELCKLKNNTDSCYPLPLSYNFRTFTIQDVLSDDLEKPIFTKNDINNCGEYCESLFSQGAPYTDCTDSNETAILNLELEQIYCAKLLRYEQKIVGQEVKEDAQKKLEYEIELAEIKAIEDSIKNGEKEEKKCKRALKFIGGQNKKNGKTVQEIDSMMQTEPYKSIYESLQASRIDKARENIQAITDENFTALKPILLQILN